MSRADELVELIRGRIHSEFDGECHLTDTEAHAIADFLSETAAALDEREIASGLTSNGNLWRFWAQKAKDMAVKLSEAEQRVPEGWKLVPIEPTDEMIKAFRLAHGRKCVDIASPYPTEHPDDGGGPIGYGYRAMLAASPALSPSKPTLRDGWAFAVDDYVCKKSGSWWAGRVVGFYTTEQTPRGYAVQLDKPFGPVQIYPESALERFIPSEPHEADGRETPRRGDPSIFDDAEGRN